MGLRLTITSEQCRRLGERSSFVFDGSGGSIGRAHDNHWVLPDPQRYLSAHHARIQYRHGGYFIEDTSSNGLYLNNDEAPLGRRGPQHLRAGDTLRLGEYLVRVAIDSTEAQSAEASAITPLRAPGSVEAPGEADLGTELKLQDLLVVPDPDSGAVPRLKDNQELPPLLQDPGLLEFDSGPRAKPRAQQAAPPSRRTPATNGEVPADSFWRGAGIDATKLPVATQPQLMHVAGLLLREVLVGLKDLAATQRKQRQSHGLSTAAEEAEYSTLQNLSVEELLERLLLGHERHELDAVQWLRELLARARRQDEALLQALRPALTEFSQHLDPGPQHAERFRSITDMNGGRLPHLFAEALARAFREEFVRPAAEE
ncbi:MAG TPA: type VI secretion system-associated FHA domain protein TagH [Steroidobacteraceae bacterium]